MTEALALIMLPTNEIHLLVEGVEEEAVVEEAEVAEVEVAAGAAGAEEEAVLTAQHQTKATRIIIQTLRMILIWPKIATKMMLKKLLPQMTRMSQPPKRWICLLHLRTATLEKEESMLEYP
jgi:hypothetical protein